VQINPVKSKPPKSANVDADITTQEEIVASPKKAVRFLGVENDALMSSQNPESIATPIEKPSKKRKRKVEEINEDSLLSKKTKKGKEKNDISGDGVAISINEESAPMSPKEKKNRTQLPDPRNDTEISSQAQKGIGIFSSLYFSY
jgi:hypothetical protein